MKALRITVALPEGYDDVCEELCVEDMKIDDGFEILRYEFVEFEEGEES